jgi:hypothetical protein
MNYHKKEQTVIAPKGEVKGIPISHENAAAITPEVKTGKEKEASLVQFELSIVITALTISFATYFYLIYFVL